MPRVWFWCALVVAANIQSSAVAASQTSQAATPFAETNDQGVQVADLKEQLEKGLQARRPVEFKFIANVVALVQQKKLPLDLVLSVFHWARRQVISRKYPFPYFERAMRILAARRGVTIP